MVQSQLVNRAKHPAKKETPIHEASTAFSTVAGDDGEKEQDRHCNPADHLP